MIRRVVGIAVSLLALACGGTESGGTGGGTVETPTTPPTTPPEPPVPPAPPPPAVADPASVPFEWHVPDAPELQGDAGAGARAWVELARTAFGPTLPQGGFRLIGAAKELFGVEMIELQVHADPDGSSGHSGYPIALVRREGTDWTFVHVVMDHPPLVGRDPVRPLADTHLRIASCDRESHTALLAIPYVDRGAPVAERCTSLMPEVARTFLARATGPAVEFTVRSFLGALGQITSPGLGLRLALRRSEVPRDTRWRPNGAFVGFVAERQGDVVSSTGMYEEDRIWFKFALRVEGEAVSLQIAVIGEANSHGVPP